MEEIELEFNHERRWRIIPAPAIYRIVRNGMPIEIHSYIPGGGHGKEFFQTSTFTRPRFAHELAKKLNEMSGTQEYSVVVGTEFVHVEPPPPPPPKKKITEYYHPTVYTARDILGE